MENTLQRNQKFSSPEGLNTDLFQPSYIMVIDDQNRILQSFNRKFAAETLVNEQHGNTRVKMLIQKNFDEIASYMVINS